MSYEKVRLILNAMMIGEHDPVQVVNKNLQLSAERRTRLSCTLFASSAPRRGKLCWCSRFWKQLEDSGSSAEEVFRDAIAMLEGEGTVLHPRTATSCT